MPRKPPAAKKTSSSGKNSSLKKRKPAKSETSQTLVKWCFIAGILSLVILPVAALKLAAWKIHREREAKAAQALVAPAHESSRFKGIFTLTDPTGATVTEATYHGKYLLVYFGYTYCPDLCPTALQNITETLDALGPDAGRVQALFVTVDPARDTPDKLKEYTASFHPGITGLTGTPRQIAAAAEAFGVSFHKAEMVNDEDYVMDHTTFIYILDPEGKPVTSLDMEEADPDSVADLLRELWTKTGKQRPAGSP